MNFEFDLYYVKTRENSGKSVVIYFPPVSPPYLSYDIIIPQIDELVNH